MLIKMLIRILNMVSAGACGGIATYSLATESIVVGSVLIALLIMNAILAITLSQN